MAVHRATRVLGSAPATTPSKAEVGRDTKGSREVLQTPIPIHELEYPNDERSGHPVIVVSVEP